MIENETGIRATLVRSSGGAFEVSQASELIYSKLRTGAFPDQRDILRAIGEKDPDAYRG